MLSKSSGVNTSAAKSQTGQRINQTLYEGVGNDEETFVPQSHLRIFGKQRSHRRGDVQAL